ncbi:ATPase [Amylibacter kogurei]|uniref:histidine kinase n=1 Tax=Paramylibacter kogurei TaxID=1889778 RepID=A0A2G5K322_9RHOB|nr:HAMP domain-containing sensor histidine kinase [Amylibacter kogurei]PIB23937.1 ATPase [Amylibacter kogurei]
MFVNTLSGRFLLLTVLFIMLAEVFIFVPSVARFRYEYLHERLERSQIASLALLAAPNDMVEESLEKELLNNADVLNIVLRRDEMRQLVLASPMPAAIDRTYDLRNNRPWTLIKDAFHTLFNGGDHVIRVMGFPVKDAGQLIEITMKERPLHDAMVDYGWNILWLSLVISSITSALLFFAVRKLMVQPINRVVRQMQSFESAPEDRNNIIQPKAGVKELYQAEVALQSMEKQLSKSLRQKERLAALGGAVSKISHDLRNILTTTQLLADRMEMSDDPRVQKTAPKLVSSLSRAVNLCERTLTYGKAEEAEPEIKQLSLYKLIEDVAENERLPLEGSDISIEIDINKSLHVAADEEQLHRVISNLVRNAGQVLVARQMKGVINLTASDTKDTWDILIRDNGPGLPAKALDNLFTAFEGGARAGGSGLGLAISAELIKGHGGKLELVETGENGTLFRVSLPKHHNTDQ